MHQGWPADESILDEADAIVIYADGTKVIGSGWAKMDQLVKEKKIASYADSGYSMFSRNNPLFLIDVYVMRVYLQINVKYSLHILSSNINMNLEYLALRFT